MKKSLVLDIIRWTLVLPVVVLVHAIAYYVYLWLTDDSNIAFFRYIEIIMAFAFSSGVSVIAGSLTAPHHREITSTVICTILCTLMMISLVFMVSRYDNFGIVNILGNIASIIGSIIGAYIIHEEV